MACWHDFPLRLFDEVASTNDTLHEAAEAGAPEGTTHIARRQTRGRGRRRRAWWSPPGAGLWMSTLLRPPVRRPQWGALALIAGVAARRALEDLGVRGVDLVWPNDLEVAGRKLGGILCEARERASSVWLVLGIGINIDLTTGEARDSMPEDLRDRITCATAAGPPRTKDPEAIARAILAELSPLYARFLAREPVPRIAGDALAQQDREVEVLLPGGEILRGSVAGLGESGELLVRDASGRVRAVHAGEVTYPE